MKERDFDLGIVARKLVAHGMKQAEIGQVLGIPQGTVSYCVRGVPPRATVRTMLRVAEWLDLDLDEVLRFGSDEDYMPTLPPTDEMRAGVPGRAERIADALPDGMGEVISLRSCLDDAKLTAGTQSQQAA